MSVATTGAVETQETTVSKDYKWTLTAFQKQGTLWLAWSTTAPFRAQQGQISVYANPFPPTRRTTGAPGAGTTRTAGAPDGIPSCPGAATGIAPGSLRKV